jgi:hypothetical protein
MVPSSSRSKIPSSSQMMANTPFFLFFLLSWPLHCWWCMVVGSLYPNLRSW